jgi:hypothetical protein
MPTTKKPRKKYKPKPNLQDPVGYLMEGLQSIRSKGPVLLGVQLKNSAAMSALLRGGATRADMDTLIAMSNISEALQRGGFGDDYYEVTTRGREALISIADRSARVGKFVPAGPEIGALNELMELHDAQMNVITVTDLQCALICVQREIAKGKALRLPGMGENA